jgi:hypothetical protein
VAADQQFDPEAQVNDQGGVATMVQPVAPVRGWRKLATSVTSSVTTVDPSVDEPTQLQPEPSPWRRWSRLPGVLYPIAVFVVWRVAQILMTLNQHGSPVHQVFQYDGSRYLQILHNGYANWWVTMPNTAFFPLLSWMARPVRWVTGSDLITAHIFATLTGLAAFVTVWGVTQAWRDERTARRAVVLLALFPASVFLAAFYSEGLFIALGAGAVWADRRDRHNLATACMFGIAATRSIGILVPAVIVLARLIRIHRIDRLVVQYTLAAVAGLGSVMVVMGFETGDPLAFMKVQGDWGRSISWPWSAVAQGWNNLWPDERTTLVPTLIARNLDLYCVLIVLATIGYAAWAARKKLLPMEAWMLGVVLISLPLFSSILASFNRFAMADWVIYPVWATWAERQRPWVRRAFYVAIAVVLGYTTWVMVHQVADGRYVA